MTTREVQIHPTAIISQGAKIGQNVKIGPYCIIGSQVTIGDNVEIKSHVVIDGKTTIGDNCIIFPFASIGSQPQDLKYCGEASEVIIGKNNSIREYVTIQPGTEGGGMVTRVGDNCLFMIGTHIAHDCQVGNNVIFANNATLAGHVKVGDYVVIGGLAGIHQYVRIGEHAMIGALSFVGQDVIPFGTVAREAATLEGINMLGMKRRNYSHDKIREVIAAFEILFDENSDLVFGDRIKFVQEKFKNNSPIQAIIEFLNQSTTRAICQPKKEKYK